MICLLFLCPDFDPHSGDEILLTICYDDKAQMSAVPNIRRRGGIY
jgi:hypothetical protein